MCLTRNLNKVFAEREVEQNLIKAEFRKVLSGYKREFFKTYKLPDFMTIEFEEDQK